MTRLVLDTSVLLSGAIAAPTSPLSRLLVAARAGTFEMIACPLIFEELRRGLAKPYVRNASAPRRPTNCSTPSNSSPSPCPTPPRRPRWSATPDDDFLIALAATSNADAIVTGDRDFLDHPDLHPPAINARTACELLGLPA